MCFAAELNLPTADSNSSRIPMIDSKHSNHVSCSSCLILIL